MGINIKATATNNADWNFTIQATDSDTGLPVDFTGAAISVQVRDNNKCQVLSGSIADGKVTLPEVGVIEWLFPVAEMKSVCPASYNFGCVYLLNGETISLCTGELAVTDGVARL